MGILAIETSGPQGSIALCQNRASLAEMELERAPRRHAQTLVTQIRDLLGEHGLSVAALEGVAVSIGPGSFTGLRVGVVCAKVIAYATGCPLAAVDTLEAIAANSPTDIDRVHVVADAQRGDLFVGTYHRGTQGDWIVEAPPTILAREAWFEGLQTGDVVTGPGLAVSSRASSTNQKGSPALAWRRLPESTWIPSARTVATIGARQIARGLVADCRTLEPFYLRRSAAEERADAAGLTQQN
jgi:tRNA threonylcarbamoyladenosine biosynthesis protein TsaB